MSTRQIKLGPNVFKNELSIYRDWKTSFFRENFQNSIDAGADRIDIEITPTESGKCLISFGDNGTGMTMDTLENTYFVLGETTKGSASDIGGFGRARILFFAQQNYSLHTHNIKVEGVGAEWTPSTTDDFYDGVLLQVTVDAPAHEMKVKLQDYLRSCYIKGKVFINGVRWTEWTYARNHQRDLSFGSVYTNKSKRSEVLVRIDGVTMYSTWMRAPYQVVVEMFHDDQHNPRTVLQANRDGLQYKYSDELDDFIADININKQSALKKRSNKSGHFHIEGTQGTFRSARSKVKEEIAKIAAELIDSGVSAKDLAEHMMRRLQARPDLQPFSKTEVIRTGMDLFDVVIDDESENPSVRKVIDSYNPVNWDLEGQHSFRNGKSFRAGVDKYKLLLMWRAAIEKVLQLFLDSNHRLEEEYKWGVGWVFGDTDSITGHQTGARHSVRDDGTHYLMLNPVKNDGTMAYSLSRKDDWATLVSFATHEVCHMLCRDHDEDFANTLTHLQSKVNARLSEVFGAMKAAKDAVNESVEAV